MARTGKIARLPQEIRRQLNRRLDDGESGKGLVEWLNSRPELQAVMAAEFEGRPITEQNLSEWKQRGYREWVVQQETLEQVKRMASDADELSQATGERLTDKLAVCLAGRYAMAVAEWDGNPESGIGRKLRVLRALALDVVELRRGDHSAARLKIEQTRLEDERSEANRVLEELFWEWARQPENRDKICKGYKYVSKDEKMHQIRTILFGCAPDSPPIGGADQASGKSGNGADDPSNEPPQTPSPPADPTKSD
jgi:hypothetical protein